VVQIYYVKVSQLPTGHYLTILPVPFCPNQLQSPLEIRSLIIA